MARRTVLFFDAESEVAESAETSSAKITLVKPALPEQEEQHMAAPLQPRPKFGMLSSHAPTASADPALESVTQSAASSDIQKDWKEWDREAPRNWDYKFALALVALLIIVNTGLVLLMHGDKGTQSVVIPPAVAKIVPPAPIIPTIAPAPVSKPIEAAASVAPAQPITVVPVVAAASVAPTPVVQRIVTAPPSATPPAQPAVSSARASQDLLSILTKE